ncbi:heavy metal-responsive transcriptional regulator [Microbacterium sp. 18062]|uniref:heavy metal-responsive transcriptional regulator n=1 Tax=Microbacterium sp. 18062 TaxID=2681410 RepID=UPI001F212F6B|nr:heavy metal-responsive transcriptional regulator [Microbacterium sp. 18062]
MTPSALDRPFSARTRRTIRASAVYDLVVTGGFALPFTAPTLFAALGALHAWLDLPGSAPSPDVFTILFANLMGSIVSVWSLFRLLRPSYTAGVADIVARVLFSLGMAAALAHGASPILGVMLALEVGWAIVQAIASAAWAEASHQSRGPRPEAREPLTHDTRVEGMRISELAQRAGVPVSTVRFYERNDILPVPERGLNGYRVYSADDVRTVRYLRRGQELGFTLRELSTLTRLSEDVRASGIVAGDVAQQARDKIAEIDGRIADLARTRDAIAGLLDAQCLDPEATCPIIDTLAN